MLEIDSIYNEDCIECMKRIDEKSIDLIICDLPYGQTNNKWDEIIPFKDLWREYCRIIKDNGAIILFGSGMFTALTMLSNRKMWRYNLVWKKGDRTSGFLNSRKMPLRNHEDIMVFYKKLPTYNPQFTEGNPTHSNGNKLHKLKNNNYGKYNEIINKRNGCTLKYPKSVLNFDRPHPPIHPTQKPVELYEYLIKLYTNEGEIVLDNCSGSGTIAIAALNTKRHFIGIESDKKYFDLSIKRIEQYLEK